MHIRCPHCHNPMDVINDDPSGDVSCPSCGSCFNLAKDTETAQDDGTHGRKISHFQLLHCLGQGAFGAVWKARDTELDRIVAIKIPRKENLTEADAEKFLREARAAAQVRHPNIVSVYEVGREDGQIYIASDFIDGTTLDEWIQAHPLTVRESVELCAKIAEALHHAHEAGVVHRDLKPQNILVTQARRASEGSSVLATSDLAQTSDPSLARRASETLTPFITDFGLAKRDAGEITMTVEGAILGTPAYMSPEQARGEAHHADRRSDVYSLGVILFRLLTGELPFRGQRQMLIVQILSEEPPALRKLDARLPRDVETICLKCLEKDPARRYQSAAALAADLRRWLTGHPIQARPVSNLEKAVRWNRRNPLFVAVLSFLCTAVVVGCSCLWYVLEVQYKRALHTNDSAIVLRLYKNLRTSHLSNLLEPNHVHGIGIGRDDPSRSESVPHSNASTDDGCDQFTTRFNLVLGEHSGEIRFFSEHPFPSRQSRVPDEIELKALADMRRVIRSKDYDYVDPDYRARFLDNHSFQRMTEAGDSGELRTYKWYVMKASCVACHNQHPESPKTDWSEGDVAGEIEAIEPLSFYLSARVFRMKLAFAGTVMAGVLLVGVMAFFMLRRTQ